MLYIEVPVEVLEERHTEANDPFLHSVADGNEELVRQRPLSRKLVEKTLDRQGSRRDASRVPVRQQQDADVARLRAQKLPARGHWQAAVRRAQDIFGVATSELLNAANVSRLASDVRAKAQSWRADAHALVARLSSVQRDFAIDPVQTRRSRTARAVSAGHGRDPEEPGPPQQAPEWSVSTE